MSDLEIVLEDIEALQSCISAAIYAAKRNGDVEWLEMIAEALGDVIATIPLTE